jgi:Predicted integral membrane zinc-ribbon metal-binding protein
MPSPALPNTIPSSALPPPITQASFTRPPENIPAFHPSAFSPPPSPTIPAQQHSKTFFDRVLDLLVGEDENAADHRYALICRHCRAHNGLAPPGERGDSVGYLCGRCGGWNGPEPNKQKEKSESTGKDGGDVVTKEKEAVVGDGKVETVVGEPEKAGNDVIEKSQVAED